MTVCSCRRLLLDLAVVVVAMVLDDDMAMTMMMAMMLLVTMTVVALMMTVEFLPVPGLLPIGIDAESLLYDDDKLVAAFSIPSFDLLPSPDPMD